jgi:multiple sugar transport system substrate-binding protein
MDEKEKRERYEALEFLQRKVSRRDFIKGAVGTAVGAGLLMSPGMNLLYAKGKRTKTKKGAAPEGPITLEFVVWNYALDTIQDNIKKFEAANPDVKVKLTDYTWPTYHDTLVLRFKGKTRTDIIYNGEDWLPEWAAAGWVAPLEDYFPDIKQYKDKTANYALADMTYKGKLYGLSYYADLITFQFNKKIFEDHRIDPPGTWDAVLEACQKLKKDAKIAQPFVYQFDQTLPNFLQDFMSQVYGRGGEFFDADLNPVFADSGSEAIKHMQWLQDLKVKHGLMGYSPHESKINIAMNTGQHAMAVMYNYMLAAMNGPASRLAGQFDMTLMPGSTHACLGFAKFYCMTQQAAEDEYRREAAWKFIEAFGGGDYSVAKRWAVENGLGFAALPLMDDPDVIKAWNGWIDMNKFKEQAKLAKNGTQTEWMGMWSEFFRPLMAKGINGDASPTEVMEQGAEKWIDYKKLLMG